MNGDTFRLMHTTSIYSGFSGNHRLVTFLPNLRLFRPSEQTHADKKSNQSENGKNQVWLQEFLKSEVPPDGAFQRKDAPFYRADITQCF